jgi:transcriptional regulator with XRE-family HTH domain
MTTMNTYEFTIIATGLDPYAANFADRFFEAGCDDATISFQKGAIILDFDREARTFGHALTSAIADVEKAGADVVHVEPDHLVSLSDIAVRAGITRAAASNWAKGERGKNSPAPVARVTTDSPLWDWVDVSRWLHRQGRLPIEDVLRARFVRGVNLSIVERREAHMLVIRREARQVAA